MGFLDFATRRDVRQLSARIGRLEALVELMARRQGITDAELAGLGLGESRPVSARVRQLTIEGRKIAAIKQLREETGLGLKEAKDVVDAL